MCPNDYGVPSGNEEYDKYLESNTGKFVFLALEAVANRIKEVSVEEECSLIEFRRTFVKRFLCMLIGCDEQGKPMAKL